MVSEFDGKNSCCSFLKYTVTNYLFLGIYFYRLLIFGPTYYWLLIFGSIYYWLAVLGPKIYWLSIFVSKFHWLAIFGPILYWIATSEVPHWDPQKWVRLWEFLLFGQRSPTIYGSLKYERLVNTIDVSEPNIEWMSPITQLIAYYCVYFFKNKISVLFFSFSTEGELGGRCATAASDSCSDSNAGCVGGTCQCNSGYYDDDGISNNNAGTCVLRK